MGTHIHIRDFDDTLHDALVKKAREKELSLTQFLKLELAKIAKRTPPESAGDMLVQLPRQGHVSPWSSQRTVRMIHEGRAERQEQIDKALNRRLSRPD